MEDTNFPPEPEVRVDLSEPEVEFICSYHPAHLITDIDLNTYSPWDHLSGSRNFCAELGLVLLVVGPRLPGSRASLLTPEIIWLIIALRPDRFLAFLHTLDTKVIYRDFKASNILLDESYNAKISDFGLARVGPEADATHVSTQVMGIHGYAAPEYIATGHLTTKSDVYVLLELLTGLVTIVSRRLAEQQNLVDWMKSHLSDMRKLNSMIDPCSESAPQIAQLALNCLQMNPKCRPTMQQVVDKLESFNTAAQKP